jgi:hypothetical protein
MSAAGQEFIYPKGSALTGEGVVKIVFVPELTVRKPSSSPGLRGEDIFFRV